MTICIFSIYFPFKLDPCTCLVQLYFHAVTMKCLNLWITTSTPTATKCTTARFSLKSIKVLWSTLEFLPIHRLDSFQVFVIICRFAICLGDHNQKGDHHQETSNNQRLKGEKVLVDPHQRREGSNVDWQYSKYSLRTIFSLYVQWHERMKGTS